MGNNHSDIWRPIIRIAYRPAEAAAAIGISLNTMLRWEKDGLLPRPYKVNGVTLYDRKELEECWERLKEESNKPTCDEPNPWDNEA